MKKNRGRSQKKASLFVGRWQPFHKGHKELIESVLKRGKPVVIAIRDTPKTSKNPYTISERRSMIKKFLKKYEDLVQIVVILDIAEFCYGRDVGYDIRKIDLDKNLEKISGTSIRGQQLEHFVFWITGQSGSGKTTLANALFRQIGGVVLDGDEMRASISRHEGFSREDRHTHNLRLARLAGVLVKRSHVIISVIAPFQNTRDEIDLMISPIWVYAKRSLPFDKDKPYEVPKSPNIRVDTERESVEEQVQKIVDYLKSS